MAEPTVAAGIARGLMQLAVSKGADLQMLALRSKIDPEDLQHPDARIPFAKYVALMRAGQELCNDPALALHYAEEVDLSEVSVVGLLTHACETMFDAFVQLNRYNRLVSEHDSVATPDRFQHWPAGQGNLWLVDTLRYPSDFPESVEGSIGRLVCGPRRFYQSSFAKAVHFVHAAPTYRHEYDRIFRVPVVFESDKNAILIDESWPTQKIAPKQRYAFGILSAHAETLLESLENSKSTRGRVESVLIPILHTRDVTMAAIARKLGLSRPTLYRQLKAEGVGYESLVDELRHKMALEYLNGRKVSIIETAYLVGFSDPAAFSRAFKRWTGSSPGQRTGV
jgi:AraC-like DNA-binding protein